MKRRSIIILSVIAVIVLAVIGWNVYGWWLKHKLERYQAELIAHGEKLTVNDLMANHRAPEFNSADYLLRSTARVHADGLLATNPPWAMRMIAPGRAAVGWQQPLLIDIDYYNKHKQPLTNTWAELSDYMDTSRDGIALLQEITAHPELDFHLDYNIGPTLMLPHLMPLKRSAQVLSAAAVLDLHKGDTASVVQEVRAILALVKGTQDERLAISQLVRIAVFQIAVSTTWELLQSPDVSAADLKQIQDDFAGLDFINAMRQAFEMERAMGSLTIGQYRRQGGIYEMYSAPGSGTTNAADFGELIEGYAKKVFSPSAIRKTSSEALWKSALSYEDERKHLQGMSVLIEGLREAATNRSFAEVYSNISARLNLDAKVDSEENSSFFMRSDEPSFASIRREFTDTGRALANCMKRVQSAEASRVLATSAIALKRYQTARKDYPAELDALTSEYLPKVPLDPIDGKPLRYRVRTEGGFLLYSIGDDAVDDGGDASSTSTSSTFGMMRGKDWVWPQPATLEEVRAWVEKNSPHDVTNAPDANPLAPK